MFGRRAYQKHCYVGPLTPAERRAAARYMAGKGWTFKLAWKALRPEMAGKHQ